LKSNFDWLKSTTVKVANKRREFLKGLKEKGFEVFKYTRSPEENARIARLAGEIASSGFSVADENRYGMCTRLYVFWGNKPMGCIAVLSPVRISGPPCVTELFGIARREVEFQYYWFELNPEGRFIADNPIILDDNVAVANNIARDCGIRATPDFPFGVSTAPEFLLKPEGRLVATGEA